jgi:hypothetical protein
VWAGPIINPGDPVLLFRLGVHHINSGGNVTRRWFYDNGGGFAQVYTDVNAFAAYAPGPYFCVSDSSLSMEDITGTADPSWWTGHRNITNQIALP